MIEEIKTPTGAKVQIYAGHFRAGGSDKVWGGALVALPNGQGAFVSCWGKRGSSLQPSVAYGTASAMRNKYLSKVSEKTTDGYNPIDHNSYGILSTMRANCPTLDDNITVQVLIDQQSITYAQPTTPTASTLARVIVSHVTPIRASVHYDQYIESLAWGMTEKVNGVRFPIEKKGDQLIGYNRKGMAQYDVPDGAKALRALDVDCLIDGERMEGDSAGQYVMFDLLEIDGESIRHRPYEYRIRLLENLMCRMYGIQDFGHPTVTGMGYMDNQLRLLTPALTPGTKRKYFDRIQDNGGEGVIFRKTDGPSIAGNTPHEIKVKFTCEIDAIITGTNLSRGTASLNLGLVREPDGTIIDIGSVRSGLTDADVAKVQAMLDLRRAPGRHNWPVIKVSFLKARTVGVKLVEPTAWVKDIREDKAWRECTTEQLSEIFGDDRYFAIATAGRALLDV